MKKLKISLLNISCIFFLSIILYININNNIPYQFIGSNNIQQLLPIYFNALKAESMLMNKINLPENQSSLPLNEIKNLVGVGEISSSNNTASTLPNQTIYSNNVNLIGKNASQYVFSKNKSEIHSPESNSHTLEFEKAKIALVKPTFTDAAYHNAFYVFYRMYENVPANTNVTSNLNLYTSKLSSNQEGSIANVYAMLDLIKDLKWIF